MNKPDTFETDHPTITEITIGDKFELLNGTIVTFIRLSDVSSFRFLMIDKFNREYTYSNDLKYTSNFHTYPLDVKHKYITFKEKIDLL